MAIRSHRVDGGGGGGLSMNALKWSLPVREPKEILETTLSCIFLLRVWLVV